MKSDCLTIFALSSGQPPSGIAVVRVSGPAAGDTLETLARQLPSPRRATRAMLSAPGGVPIDDALVLWFPGPHSATGEDVAEYHIHGGRAVVAALVEALGAIDGLRPADPGEFSQRAFENGKLDLVAAEALDDLIHADTEQQRRHALRQLNGLLGDRARDWRQRIIDASVFVEVCIDFSEEGDVATVSLEAAGEAIAALQAEIDDVLASNQRSERLREGLVIAIAGRPNVGKSTLLNILARRDVAIVTPHAGTTRDILEVALDLDGYPVTLIDTAGLRNAVDPVEQEGIRRALTRAAAADLVLWLDDGDGGVAQDFGGIPIWTVRTKADLGRGGDTLCDHVISAAFGDGLGRLADALCAFAAGQFPSESAMISRARHRDLLSLASRGLQSARLEQEPELIAEGLRQAAHVLGRLLGHVDVEDILASIFSHFCIGK